MRAVTPILPVVIGRVLPASVTQIALGTAGAPQEPRVIVTMPLGLLIYLIEVYSLRLSPSNKFSEIHQMISLC